LAKALASAPKEPMPYAEGREKMGRRMPAERFINKTSK
jgi:hypothetical protein